MKRILCSCAVTLAIILLVFSNVYAAGAGEDNITRAEVAAMVLRYADDYVSAVEMGDIIKGDGTGNLFLDREATGYEALAMIARGFGGFDEPKGHNLRMSIFDTDISNAPFFFSDELNTLQKAGVLGRSVDYSKPISKADFERLLARVFELKGTNLRDDYFSTVLKDDFDRSVCKEGEVAAGAIVDAEKIINDRVEGLIKDAVKLSNDKGTPEQKIATFYQNLLDIQSRNGLGTEPLKPYIKRIMDTKNAQELADVSAAFTNEMGLFLLFNFGVYSDIKDSSTNMLYMSSVGSGLSKAELETDAVKDLYIDKIAKFLALAGVPGSEATEGASRMYEMYKRISAVSLDPNEVYDADKIYNVFTADELQKTFKGIDMKKYFNTIGLGDINRVCVTDKAAFIKAAQIIGDQKNFETLKYMALYDMVNSFSLCLSEDVYDVYMSFNTKRLGITGKRTNERMALETVKSEFGSLLGRMYTDRYVSDEAVKNVSKMVGDIKKVYIKRIEGIEWMSPETKERAITKLMRMGAIVGYSDRWDTFYDNTEIKSYAEGGGLVENRINMGADMYKYMLSELHKPVDKMKLSGSVYTINAYNDISSNVIALYAGIMIPPFYDDNNSYEENIAGIGSIIGHEITHAFDSAGAKFDENGNATDWWTPEDYTHFEGLCKTIITPFDGVEVAPDIINNGTLTLMENIADLGAISVTLELLRESESPDYDRFFRNYTRCWGDTRTREVSEFAVNSDVHSPGKVRVNNVIKQFEEFYQTYNVTPEDWMYVKPEDRVSLW